MSDFTDLRDQVDTHDERLMSLEDNSVDDLAGTLQSIQDQQQQDEQNIGQLSFPLTQETIDLIKEQFPSGFITLSGGTATLRDPRITPSSVILLTVAAPGGTQGFLSYNATSGQAVITSTAAETSTIAYLILS